MNNDRAAPEYPTPAAIEAAALAQGMCTDQPCREPAHDKFGFMPTARVVARAIQHAPAAHGQVLHIDGEWGSGKSSMLGLVEHLLQTTHANGQKPVQVHANSKVKKSASALEPALA